MSKSNFEGDWKKLHGFSYEKIMRGTRMVIGAILLAIPFPFSLVDWFFRMTRWVRSFPVIREERIIQKIIEIRSCNVRNGLIMRGFSQCILFLFH
jgi:hypothetical protein